MQCADVRACFLIKRHLRELPRFSAVICVINGQHKIAAVARPFYSFILFRNCSIESEHWIYFTFSLFAELHCELNDGKINYNFYIMLLLVHLEFSHAHLLKPPR